MHDLGQEVVFYELKQLDEALVHISGAVDDLKAFAVYHFAHRGLDKFGESLNLSMQCGHVSFLYKLVGRFEQILDLARTDPAS